MADGSISTPAIAGLAVGIAFITLFVIGDNIVAVENGGSGARILPDGNDNKVMPDNFKIVYSYGIGLDYTLAVDDTGIGLFTAENCSYIPTQHATLALSQQDLESIWKAVQENGFFSLSDLTEECPPSAISCRAIFPADRAELQITTGDETNKVEFHQNYALNHSTEELKRFNAIVSVIEEVLAHHENLPESDCAYA